MASVPLKSRSCRRFSNSAFLAAMRVESAEDCCCEDACALGWRIEFPLDAPGRMDVGRDEYAIVEGGRERKIDGRVGGMAE